MLRSKNTRTPSAQVVLPSADLNRSIEFFRATLGFRLESIFPADEPRVAVMSGLGIRIRLDAGVAASSRPGLLIETDDAGLLAAAANGLEPPGEISIEIVPADGRIDVPPIDFCVSLTRPGAESPWVAGRAGMEYRDLIPGRLGGAVIASQIRIPEGGPVPDYVHYHRVRFQIIFCLNGWVRLVYEDQGPSFVMQSGDCILQPPGLRHRVLECSDGFDVVEVGCPAEHETRVDHDLGLPNAPSDTPRATGDQRFHFHRAGDAVWAATGTPGLDERDTGVGAASGSAVAAIVYRARGKGVSAERAACPGFTFCFVLSGSLDVSVDGAPAAKLETGAALTVARKDSLLLEAGSADTRWLEVRANPA